MNFKIIDIGLLNYKMPNTIRITNNSIIFNKSAVNFIDNKKYVQVLEDKDKKLLGFYFVDNNNGNCLELKLYVNSPCSLCLNSSSLIRKYKLKGLYFFEIINFEKKELLQIKYGDEIKND